MALAQALEARAPYEAAESPLVCVALRAVERGQTLHMHSISCDIAVLEVGWWGSLL